MSETDAPPPPKKKGMNCGMWIVVGVLVVIFAGLANPWGGSRIQGRARMLQASNNCRSIMIALKSYASDHNGHFPETELAHAKTSNDVFRMLFKLQLVEDERVFGAPFSFANADNLIGEAPEFEGALEAGENHWCIAKGLADESDGNRAFIFENPAHDYAWPPVWNADVTDQPQVGRAWKGGKILVGRNDGSVNPEKLISTQGPLVPLTDEVNAVLFPPSGSFLPVAK